jgi:hypothetical protein
MTTLVMEGKVQCRLGLDRAYLGDANLNLLILRSDSLSFDISGRYMQTGI